jgi:hypothetical protein
MGGAASEVSESDESDEESMVNVGGWFLLGIQCKSAKKCIIKSVVNPVSGSFQFAVSALEKAANNEG